MTAGVALDRRALFRGQFGAQPVPSLRLHPVEAVSAGPGDVFWCGWADDQGIFVGGDGGAILAFDGRAWTRAELPVPLPVHGFWGTRRDALWAVGWMGLILRHDGTDWHRVRGACVNPDGKYGSHPENTPLFAIDGRADGLAWAVGDAGTILHWDGQEWRPEASGTRLHLRTVLCLSDGRVLAAGHSGTVLLRDGVGRWSPLACPVSSGFVSALELSGGRVLLAGGRYFVPENGFRGDLVLLEREELHPVFAGARFSRFRALAPAVDGVIAVGDCGAMHLIRDDRIDALETGTPHDLLGLVPLPEGQVLVVGDFGTVLTGSPAAVTAVAPAVRRGAESRWQPMTVPTDRQLWGLWTDPASGVSHACGEDGTVLVLDRGQWQALPPAGPLALHALNRAPDGGLLAAGQRGEIHHFDGSTWRKHFDLMLDCTILSLWSDGAGCLIAAGDEGLILRHDGQTWQRMASGTTSGLYGLWGTDARHLLAVGDFGLVLRWNGQTWDSFNIGTERFVFGVWGRGLDDIHVVGLSGTLGHFDGRRWTMTPARARQDLLAVTGTDRSVMAVGAGGAAMLHDGAGWIPDPTGIETGLRAVVAAADGGFIAAGDGGRILRREPVSG